MELVRTATSDGLRLDGAKFEAAAKPGRPLDAVILLHGVGGNFYGGSLFRPLVQQLTDLGVTAYRVNTRGHDGMFAANTTSGPRRFGAACEIVDECRLDVAAWINHAANAGAKRIGILGHSLGAIKAAYSQAHEPDERVVALMLMSPPRLSYEVFVGGRQRDQFLAAMAEANQLVEAGRGDDWFNTQFPVPLVITGSAFVDKYGPQERYNIMRFLDRLGAETLLLYGQKEVDSDNSAFAALPEAIAGLPSLPGSLKLTVIADADHFYSGVRHEAATAVLDWLKSAPLQ